MRHLENDLTALMLCLVLTHADPQLTVAVKELHRDHLRVPQ